MHIRDNFSEGAPITQVPASWFNRVAKFINNLVPGDGVTLEKHDDGSPSIITAKAPDGKDKTPTAIAGGNFPVGSYMDLGTRAEPDLGFDVRSVLGANWNRGDTDETTGKRKGVKVSVCTALLKHATNPIYGALFSNLSFDENGCLVKVETAIEWSRIG